jgi:hypothetical protein
MRRNVVVRPTSMKVVVAGCALACGLAVSACGTTQLGAAAIAGSNRISATTLTSQVSNLNSAYAADKAKGISPQRPTSQEPQQVLTWLLLFQVYDRMASQHGISVTDADSQRALNQYEAQAKQSNVSLEQYWSAGAALPPDLLPQLGQAAAIQARLVAQLDNGTTPTTSAQESKVDSALSHQQCLAAKSLGISVNPQYGEYNYSDFEVVPAPPSLAAEASPSPSPSASAVVTTPPC